MQRFRLPEGGRIDRTRPLTFRYDGRALGGFAGDTLASALLANGIRLVGRSFKYHRPRGVLTAGAEEPNALVQLETGPFSEPNMRATQVWLYDGLSAASQNCWPSVDYDFGAAAGWASKLLPAGFYYKTFMWPANLWRTYEWFIRRAAGLGRAPREADPDRYEKVFAHCDVLVAGGGPAGIAAALAAGRSGARVILADEQAEMGGSLLSGAAGIDGRPAGDWLRASLAELAAMPEVRLLSRATVASYQDHNLLTVAERVTDHLGPGAREEHPLLPRHRLWKVRARQVVLATGALERPLVFADNDRPGVMLADAARTYVNRYAVRPGGRAVVFTNNDSAYRAALDLEAGGIDVAAIVDLRPEGAGEAAAEARSRGIEVLAGHAIVGVDGAKAVRGVEVARLSDGGDAVAGEGRRIACDLVAVSGGWNPTIHLFSQSRGRLAFDEARGIYVPGRSVQAERSAGAARGSFGLADALAEGFRAGQEAARLAGHAGGSRVGEPPQAEPEPAAAPARLLWVVPGRQPVGHGKAKHFVDHQNDVTAADIALAAREGYRSVEHAKRYTTLGMGTDQGKTSGIVGHAILARELGEPMAAVGTTTFRPPYTPVSYGAMAGRDVGELGSPARLTPIHPWHQSAGAVFEDAAGWKLPWYYPRAAEDMRQAVERECLAVREAVGIREASTLGKIDIRGPDAAKLLDWIYTNAWGSLEVGRCRYGIMLGEDGMVMDDGVTARLGPEHFLMHTSTGAAGKVFWWLEEWLQNEWTDWRVYLTSVSEQYATVNIAGPRARELLAELAAGIDLSGEAFPHMAVREGIVADIPARVFRVSFTGELSYEVNVPAGYGVALWNALMTAGARYGVTPFGSEAIHVLRAEKGYVAGGQEIDGTTTPDDLGLGWAVSRRKPDFLGKRALSRPDALRADRKQLVGLLADDRSFVIPEGAQIVSEARSRPPVPMIGHVTSSYWSPALGHGIALALLEAGRSRMGEKVHVSLADRTVTAEVVSPVFYDSDGGRLDA